MLILVDKMKTHTILIRSCIYLVLAVMLLSLSRRHPMHVSVAEVAISEEKKQIGVVLHLFLDDIEQAYRNRKGDQSLDVTLNEVAPDFRLFLEGYLASNLQFHSHSTPINFVFLGYEQEDAGIWCYLEATKVKKVNPLTVINTILIETYEDQSNLLHVTKSNTTKSMKFDRKTMQHTFSFE